MEESTLEVDSLVPLMHNDPKHLGLICLKETQNPFSDSFGFKNPILIFLKTRTLSDPQRKAVCQQCNSLLTDSKNMTKKVVCKVDYTIIYCREISDKHFVW